jgi:UDP-sulfoquinovose synthase
VFNQFTEQFNLNTLAEKVKSAASGLGMAVAIDHISNPRIEQEQHYYNANHSALIQLGLQPHLLTDEVLAGMLETALRHKDNVDESKIMPDVKWKN